MKRFLSVVLGCAMLFAAAPTLAANRQLTLVNATAHTMVRFYAATGVAGEDDILGDRILKPGQSVRIDIDDGSGACVYNFRAEFDDGSKLDRPRIDACEIATYRFTSN
jgi:hypothetical protein